MSDGFFLLHKKFFDADAWKNPAKSLAWIELCSLAAWQDYTAHDGVFIRRGEVIGSYRFFSKKWGVPLTTVHRWFQSWISERQVERRAERCVERDAERFFIVAYAKYQDIAERQVERGTEREVERAPEQIKRKDSKENLKPTTTRARALSEIETTILDALTTQGYVESESLIAWLDELQSDFKGIDLVKVARAFKWYKRKGKSAGYKNHLNAFRNFCDREKTSPPRHAQSHSRTNDRSPMPSPPSQGKFDLEV